MDTHPRLTRLTCKLAVPILALVGAAVWFTWPTANRSETPRSQMAGRPQAPVAAVIDAPFPPPAALTGEAANVQLRKDGQYESLAAAFQAARYAAEKIDPAGEHSRGAEYFAANPGQQLRAWFSQDGVELASGLPTREGAEPWSVQVRLRAAGRTAALTATAPRAIRAEGGRVEMSDREGAITEWYENKRDGLEQGFNIAQPPPGVGPLELVLAVVGKMRAVADGVHIADGDGADVVSATGLKAWDADGRTLAARMEVRGSELALVVADAGARYPVTVDPLFANLESRLVEDLAAGDGLGLSVALSGETALVGASFDNTPGGADAGSAYVFVRSGTLWSQQAKLTASDGSAYDYFGSSVALSGDTALVSAPVDDAPGDAAGSAYVFVRSGTLWSQQAKLTASDGVANDYFGSSVALNGDTALLGARNDDTGVGAFAGSAYVFVRSGTTWSQQARLIASDGAARDQFGYSVALSGDTSLVGAPSAGQTIPGNRDGAGSAYVFVRSGTLWNQKAKLTAGDGAAYDYFGESVALSGDTALVGAYGDDSDAGSAYVFLRTGTAWPQQQKLTVTASDRASGDNFGNAVALSGNTALVGARYDNPGPGAKAGSAYVFVRTGTNWNPEQKLTASDGAAGDLFGTSVALNGDTALVGAIRADGPAGADTGITYVFVLSGTQWSPQVKLTDGVDSSGEDVIGTSVAVSGDTALVGAPDDDTPAGSNAGSAYVFVRSGTLWNQQAKLTASDGAASDVFGFSVAVSGDTALVGAPHGSTPDVTDNGSAYVFVRSGTSWSQQAKLGRTIFTNAAPITINNNVPAAPYPSPMTVSGVAGNLSAVRVSLLGLRHTYPQDIRVLLVSPSGRRVLLMSGAGGDTDASNVDLTFAADATISLPVDPVAFSSGTFLPTSTDFDNSDFPSPAPAGPYTTTLTTFTGEPANGLWQLYVFDSFPTADSGSIDRGWTLEILASSLGASSQGFGYSVALSGDTALVGAPYDDTPAGTNAGSAYVFVRSGTLWSQQAKLTVSDGAVRDNFGLSVALSGETALVGAPFDDPPAGTDAGSAYVFVRSGTLWSQQAKLTASDRAAEDRFGYSVALSGDTALLGSFLDSTPAGIYAGSAYVFVRSGTLWSQQAKLTASDGSAANFFGWSVALSGDTALAGARFSNPGTGLTAGSAYVFVRSGTLWSQQAKLTAGLDSSEDDQFGYSVALSGNTALVGAPFDATAGARHGSAYAFLLGELPNITVQPVSRTVLPGAQVTFSVVATGYAPLRYQWRRNGFEIAGASSSSYAIQVPFFSPFAEYEGTYDVVVSNIGGVVTSAPAVLTVNALSQFSQLFPGAPPAAQGLVVVTLTPAGIASGWRFVGEQVWRASGAAAGGLATGDRTVEFRPTPGYIQPGAETVSVVSGGATVILNREYFESDAIGSGALTVTLKPDALAAVGVAQWRFLGEGDPTAPGDATSLTWRNSGATVTGLVPANYLVECKPVAGYTTPPPLNVQVQTAAAATATYFLAEAQTGTPPGVLPFETVATSTGLPYAYVGQLRSNVGVATGFAVRVDLARTGGARVVATAGHVVFDDGARAYAVGLQWLFQRDRGTFEPKPLIPRGAYIFDGYAARRTAEATPGVSSAQSQHLDAAAIYFIEDAARGGFGGYLASDATDNEFLTSPALKTLVGYPVDGIDAAKQGRMHATPPANVPFARVPGTTTVLPPPAPASPYPAGSPFRLYATSGIRSSGGNSGGPLCVQFEGGAYYPAGIFLGGAGQAVVRAIDSQVIDLFRRAEVSGYDGPNNTGGGIIQVNTPAASGAFSLASLTVNITPAGAVNGGAKWKLGSNGTPYNSGAQLTSMTPAAYNLVLMAAPGFITPATTSRTLTAGVLSTINVPYNGVTTHPVSRTVFAFEDATFSVVVSGTPTSYQWRFRPTVGATVLIPGATSSSYTRANADNTTQGEYAVAVTWPDGTILSNFATLTVSPTAQAITFPQPPNRILDDGSFVLDASASSDLPVTFQLLSGPATLTGNTLTPTGLGTVQVRASQAGNVNYSAAANKIRSFDVLGDNLNAWRTRRFTAAELGNPLISGALADFDGDGVNTLLEFSLNLDPKLGDRVTMTAVTGTRGLPLIRSENVSGQQRLTAEFVRRRAAGSPGITYNVELNTALTNPTGWTTGGTEVVTPIDATWERVKVTDPQPALTTRYGRLKVTMP